MVKFGFMLKIKTTSVFDKDIKKLDRQVSQRIIEKMEALANSPELLKYRVKYMPNDLEGLQKYRIGDWRVLFWLDKGKNELVLYAVDHRSQVYKKLKKRGSKD